MDSSASTPGFAASNAERDVSLAGSSAVLDSELSLSLLVWDSRVEGMGSAWSA